MISRKAPLKRGPHVRRRKPLPTAEERRHLALVASLPCAVCGATPVEVHHLRSGQGMGQRSGHFRTIPLCPTHHRTGGFGVALHAGSREFQRHHGTEEELLAWVLSMLPEAL